jgi:putative pyruvate formate lyase activating enzyme
MHLDFDSLHHCELCPRQCGVDRLAGELGYCGTGAGYSVGSICQHRGEEPAFGPEGICNVFFTRCNLQCRYCQNYQISRNRGPILEYSLSRDEAVERINRVLDRGVSCLGLVSPSHVLPQMRALLAAVRASGRNPVAVMNTNAFDRVECLQALTGEIDVYLPDLKYLIPDLARQYSDAVNYPAMATAAIKEMFRQKGPDLELDAGGVIRSGLIIRHLVLPGQVENSRQALRFIARELSPDVHISLMAQYAPLADVQSDPDLGRRLRPDEYEAVLETLDELGMENGWVQELDSSEHYQPDFRETHPFER